MTDEDYKAALAAIMEEIPEEATNAELRLELAQFVLRERRPEMKVGLAVRLAGRYSYEAVPLTIVEMADGRANVAWFDTGRHLCTDWLPLAVLVPA
jgi:hypothetical protein